METIGKILSLVFIAVVGAGGATMYILDSDKPVVEQEAFDADKFLGQAVDDDLAEYREHLRNSYVESQPPAEQVATVNKSDQSVWTDTYTNTLPDFISEDEVKSLASNNEVYELREKMNYWHVKYHKSLKNKKTLEANEAYKKHKSYKYALEYKNTFK
ncbi:MAG: hypothetical protein GWO07_02020 [Candidatus Dadabacteria bacterium]|nr:hypothetical protein [Candidatus Dadabacteria bacterium]NIS07546.1 hypothetical protein [Candidatus Dadabacteria bacterium]NIY21161.1 hypothetical protein [Candidatus Dadabacteria bacterium]